MFPSSAEASGDKSRDLARALGAEEFPASFSDKSSDKAFLEWLETVGVRWYPARSSHLATPHLH